MPMKKPMPTPVRKPLPTPTAGRGTPVSKPNGILGLSQKQLTGFLKNPGQVSPRANHAAGRKPPTAYQVAPTPAAGRSTPVRKPLPMPGATMKPAVMPGRKKVR